jgi:hypothetical protein
MRSLLLPAVLVLASPWSPAFATTLYLPDPAYCAIPDNIIVVGHDGAHPLRPWLLHGSMQVGGRHFPEVTSCGS